MADYQKLTATFVVRNDDLDSLMQALTDAADNFEEHTPIFASGITSEETAVPENAEEISAAFNA